MARGWFDEDSGGGSWVDEDTVAGSQFMKIVWAGFEIENVEGNGKA